MATTAMSKPDGFISKLGKFPAGIRRYVGELQVEMRRVTWPSWREVRSTTVVVIICVFMFAAFFAVVDLILHRVVTQIVHVFTKQ